MADLMIYGKLQKKAVVIGFFDTLRTDGLDEAIAKSTIPDGFGLPVASMPWPEHLNPSAITTANFMREDAGGLGTANLYVARTDAEDALQVNEVAAVAWDTVSEAYQWLNNTDAGKKFRDSCHACVISLMAVPTDISKFDPDIMNLRSTLGLDV